MIWRKLRHLFSQWRHAASLAHATLNPTSRAKQGEETFLGFSRVDSSHLWSHVKCSFFIVLKTVVNFKQPTPNSIGTIVVEHPRLGPSRASALGAQFDRNLTEIWFNLTWGEKRPRHRRCRGCSDFLLHQHTHATNGRRAEARCVRVYCNQNRWVVEKVYRI